MIFEYAESTLPSVISNVFGPESDRLSKFEVSILGIALYFSILTSTRSVMLHEKLLKRLQLKITDIALMIFLCALKSPVVSALKQV